MAQTVAGQQAGLLPAGAAAALWESVFCPANGGFCALAGSIPDYGEVYRTSLVLIQRWNSVQLLVDLLLITLSMMIL